MPAESTVPPDLVIGIDGGGSRTRVALAGPDGRVVGAATAGGTNLTTVDPDIVVARVADAIAECLSDLAGGTAAGTAAGTVRLAVAGFAGAGDSEAAAAVTAQALALAGVACPVEVYSDPELAFASGSAGPDGLVLIAGTGAAASRIAGWRAAQTVDGHGWLLGDGGSGFWIGAAGARAALSSLDGRAPATTLVARLAAELRLTSDVDPTTLRLQLVRTIMSEPPTALARFAPAVLAAATEGDPVATRIAAEAVEHLVATVTALRPTSGEPLVLAGGIANSSLAPQLVAALTERLGLRTTTVADGLAGAIRLALNPPPRALGEL